jgi:signal transduction histidine kinase
MALISLLVFGAWICLALLVHNKPHPADQALIGLTRTLAGGLLLAAAALRFAAWRITGLARAAWSVVALAVAGITYPVVGVIDDLNSTISQTSNLTPIARALVDFALIGFGAAALTTPAVVSRLRPIRVTAPFLLGFLALTVLITVHGPTSSDGYLSSVATALQWTTGLLWTGLTLAYVLVGWRHRRATELSVGAALTIIAAAALVRAAVGNLPYSRMVIPAGAQFLVALLVAGACALRLWQLHTRGGTTILRVSGELRGARIDLAEAERDQAQRLHDARSAILGVAGAARLLAHPEPSSGIDRQRLQDLVSAELHRLGAILDPGFRSSNRRFRPAEVLEPLILAHRLAGARIQTLITDAWALGRPEATATVVANLLANVRTHAPGAQIWITVTAEDSIQIRVEDDGPGSAEGERTLVLQSGVRGSAATAAGNGIGLSAAAQLMADQGGTLALRTRDGGGTCVVLTLQRAPSRGGEEPLTTASRNAHDGPQATDAPHPSRTGANSADAKDLGRLADQSPGDHGNAGAAVSDMERIRKLGLRHHAPVPDLEPLASATHFVPWPESPSAGTDGAALPTQRANREAEGIRR